MQLTCIKAFGLAEPGDAAEVPDGASFDTEHWAEAPQSPPELTLSPAPAAFPDSPKEM